MKAAALAALLLAQHPDAEVLMGPSGPQFAIVPDDAKAVTLGDEQPFTKGPYFA